LHNGFVRRNIPPPTYLIGANATHTPTYLLVLVQITISLLADIGVIYTSSWILHAPSLPTNNDNPIPQASAAKFKVPLGIGAAQICLEGSLLAVASMTIRHANDWRLTSRRYQMAIARAARVLL